MSLLACLVALLALAAPARGSTSAADVDSIVAAMVAKEAAYIQELIELVTFPSVSAAPEHLPDLLAAADWLVGRLQRAGLRNAQLLPNPAGPRPAVYADFLSDSDPSLPTVLIYAHYDVQPAAPLDAWASPPFKPEVRGGGLYGRGASDDKGGLLAPVQAVEAVLAAAGGRLPVKVKFLLEGEEEIGSPFLEPFLEAHAALLACDFVLSADGGQISAAQPGLTLGLRGAAALEVEVQALRRDVHSGMVRCWKCF